MHPDFRELQSLVDEELEPLDRHQISHHLDCCDRCRDAAEVLRSVARSLAAIPRAEAPCALPERLLAACAQAAPVPNISCEAALAMASDYMDGELAGLQRDTLEAHLFSCEPCYAAFRRMERTAELLRSAPTMPAPDGLYERICAAVEREQAPVPVFTWRHTAAVVAGVAAAAAVLFAVFLPRGIEQSPAPEQHIAAMHLEDATEPAAETATEDTLTPAAEDAADEVAPAPPADTSEAPARTRMAPERPRPAATSERRPAEATSPPSEGSEPAPARPASAPEERPDTETVDADADAAPHTIDLRPVPTDLPADPPATSSPTEPPYTPRETVIAREPGPATRPVPPQPVVEPQPTAPTATTADREHTHVAVVPVQPETRTLYRAAEEPSMERIARATRSVNTGVSRHWNDAETGLELR